MRKRLVALIVNLLAPFPAMAQSLELIGLYEWQTESIVGVSGIEVSPDGMGFLAISDAGWWLEGRFQRKGEVIVGLEDLHIEGIIGQDGFPVSARRVGDLSDAEGLAVAPDGRAWVGFERWPHVWAFDAPFERAQWIKDHETFYEFSDNRQLEAVALSPDGTVYAFPEQPLVDGFPIYRLDANATWQIDGYLPENDVFAIVGADFADDGMLYLLERKLVIGIWWQSRIRRINLATGADDAIWTSGHGEYGNLEGISAWSDAEGQRLTLVSDNNGSRTPTQFVEFRLTE